MRNVLDSKRNVTIGTAKTMALAAVLALTWGCTSPETTVVATEQLMAKPGPPQVVGLAGGGPTRTEHDLLGEKQVPADAYYGVQTTRALENFQISGIPINRYPEFIEAWAIVKLAAARANTDVGAMNKETLAAIEKAAVAVRKGDYKAHFITSGAYGEGEPRREHKPPLLFNLAEDPGERRNLAATHPDLVSDLVREADAHRRGVVAGRPLFDELLPAPQGRPR